MQQVQYVPPSGAVDEPAEVQRVSEVNSSVYDFAACELAYRAGGWTINALANKYKIPEATLRRFAKRHEWVAGGAELKRKIVRDALSGIPVGHASIDGELTNSLAGDELVQVRQFDEAAKDLGDMRMGLDVARAGMSKLLQMVAMVEHPKDVKLIVESNKIAVETIRKIRNLDDEPPPADQNVTIDISDGFAELRAAFHKRLQTINPPAEADGA
jgi:hypothetical protein